MNNDIVYLDKDTFLEITGKTEKEYYYFLKTHPKYINPDIEKEHKLPLSEKEKETIKNNPNKKHNDDIDFLIPLTILKLLLPKYEIVYGKFSFSSEELSNELKCHEILKYLKEVCGVKNNEEIGKWVK